MLSNINLEMVIQDISTEIQLDLLRVNWICG
jgi:hypothetical protein